MKKSAIKKKEESQIFYQGNHIQKAAIIMVKYPETAVQPVTKVVSTQGREKKSIHSGVSRGELKTSTKNYSE